MMHSKAFLVAGLLGAIATTNSANAAEVIVNGGFETGSLSPWVYGRMQYASDPSNLANEWKVTSSTSNSGTFSAAAIDNFELVQTFAPVAVSSIKKITFAANLAAPAMAYDLFYSDGSDFEYAVFGSTGWQTFDITSSLDHSLASLVGISFFGNSTSHVTGVPNYLDDVSIQTGVPEPATWAMMLIGLGGVGAAMRIARRKDAVPSPI